MAAAFSGAKRRRVSPSSNQGPSSRGTPPKARRAFAALAFWLRLVDCISPGTGVSAFNFVPFALACSFAPASASRKVVPTHGTGLDCRGEHSAGPRFSQLVVASKIIPEHQAPADMDTGMPNRQRLQRIQALLHDRKFNPTPLCRLSTAEGGQAESPVSRLGVEVQSLGRVSRHAPAKHTHTYNPFRVPILHTLLIHPSSILHTTTSSRSPISIIPLLYRLSNIRLQSTIIP